jgi:hypothetical protein
MTVDKPTHMQGWLGKRNRNREISQLHARYPNAAFSKFISVSSWVCPVKFSDINSHPILSY